MAAGFKENVNGEGYLKFGTLRGQITCIRSGFQVGNPPHLAVSFPSFVYLIGWAHIRHFVYVTFLLRLIQSFRTASAMSTHSTVGTLDQPSPQPQHGWVLWHYNLAHRPQVSHASGRGMLAM